MSIVVDSNVVAAIFIDVPYSEMAQSHMVEWLEADVSLLTEIIRSLTLANNKQRQLTK